jgi:hypothetical protein
VSLLEIKDYIQTASAKRSKVNETGTKLIILVDKAKQIPNAKCSLKRRWMKSVKHFNIILDNTI